jgi:hypothetical protein
MSFRASQVCYGASMRSSTSSPLCSSLRFPSFLHTFREHPLYSRLFNIFRDTMQRNILQQLQDKTLLVFFLRRISCFKLNFGFRIPIVLSNFIHSFIHHGSTALWSVLASCSIFLVFFTQTVGLLGRVIRQSQGRYLHTGQHEHSKNPNTDTHALSGIRTNDPSIRMSEDYSCFRPRGHSDRLFFPSACRFSRWGQ